MIAVYGVTGYTGQQIAQTLTERGYRVTLAGRTRTGLETLADKLGGQVAVYVAALDDRDALAELAAQASVIVNCVGPFVRADIIRQLLKMTVPQKFPTHSRSNSTKGRRRREPTRQSRTVP